MLAVGVVHSSKGNHRDSGGLGDVTDFDRGSQAADPLDVRLKIVDDPVAGGLKARELSIPMFACGQGLTGKPLAKLCGSLEIFWDKAVLHPFQTVWS